jgi:hypothetical protein
VSWAIGYDGTWKRDIGYGVPAYCDSPRCTEVIDRGLGYVCCNQEPYGGERGCGLYFCSKHRVDSLGRCTRCHNHRTPYAAKPDHPDWINWKLTDESWARWRSENPDEVAALRASSPRKE